MTKDDRLLDQRDLAAAFRSVREAYDGTNPESDLTLQRALFQTRARSKRQRFTRWVVLPAAAVFVASTAWAGVTGRLAPVVHTMMEVLLDQHEARPAVTTASNREIAPAAPASTSVPDVPPTDTPAAAESPALAAAAGEPPRLLASAPEHVAAQSPTRSSAGVDDRAVRSPIKTAIGSAPPHESAPIEVAAAPAVVPSPMESASPGPAPSAAASATDPHAALFAEAHRLHFIDRDPARALAAWDRYLAAAPNGRFAPEARYNRALSLIRLGRRAEARTDLASFADGAYGGYRREEAKALLDALARDASRP